MEMKDIIEKVNYYAKLDSIEIVDEKDFKN